MHLSELIVQYINLTFTKAQVTTIIQHEKRTDIQNK